MAEQEDAAKLAKEQAEKALSGTSSLFGGGGSFKNKPAVVPPEQEKVEKPEEKPVIKPDEENKEDKPDIETPLMTIKVNQGTPHPETPVEMLKAFNIKTGLGIEKWEDIAAKADDIAKMKVTAEQTEEKNRLAFGYKTLFENAPVDLKKVIIAYTQQQDYKGVAKDLFTSDIDFSKKIEDYDDEMVIIKKYNPDIVSNEEWEELGEKAQATIMKATEKAYNADRANLEKQAMDFQTQREKQADLFVESIEKAMEKVKKEYPDLKKPQLDIIHQRLSKGLKEELINDDGVTYKEDAGEKIAMMAFGKETIFAMKGSLETKIKKEAEYIAKKRVSEELELMNRNRTDKIDTPGEKREPNDNEKILHRTATFLGNNQSQFKNKNS